MKHVRISITVVKKKKGQLLYLLVTVGQALWQISGELQITSCITTIILLLKKRGGG